jgi:metallophosphoesterase superfamily enzyme
MIISMRWKIRMLKLTDEELLTMYQKMEKNSAAVARVIGMHQSNVRRRIERIIGRGGLKDQDRIAQEADTARQVLKDLGINPDDVNMGTARIKVGMNEVVVKDADGNPQTVTAKHSRAYATPLVSATPDWPVVQPAKPLIIKSTERHVHRSAKLKVAVIVTDPQIGFWRDLDTGEWIPFHDDKAMDVSIQIIRELQPDIVVNGGDLLDNPEHSPKFRKYPEFAGTTQASLNRGKLFLAEQKAAAPKAKIVLVEGNHDARIPQQIIDNAIESSHLRRAWLPGEIPDNWPVNTVPYLLGLEDLGVEYSAAYPGGDIWLGKHLVFQHQDVKINREERATVIHGHIHRNGVEWRTIYLNGGRAERGVVSVGCLCRLDPVVDNLRRRLRSAVPSGQVRHNWQQGILVVGYDPEGGPHDFDLHHIRIFQGEAFYGDEHYKASPEAAKTAVSIPF